VLLQSAQVFQVHQDDHTQPVQVAGYASKMTAIQAWVNTPANRSVNPQGS
jgi:hypothetical protein